MKRTRRIMVVAGIVALALTMVVSGAWAAPEPPGGGYYTGQTVQNIGTNSTDIDVVFYDAANPATTYTKSYPVPAGASTTFISGDLGVPSNFKGSGEVRSLEPIRAIVNVTNRPQSSYGISGGTAAAQYGGTTAEDASQSLSFPLVKNDFNGKTSAFYVQNAGDAATTFSATFLMASTLTGTPSPYPYNSPTLQPGQMIVIGAADASVPAGWIGSLSIQSAGQKLAGTILEFETLTAPGKILQGTGGFTDSTVSTKLLFPVVKKQLYGRSTGLQVQNVSGAPANVTMTYYGGGFDCPSGMSYAEPARLLQPKQSTTFLESAVLPSNCLASAVVTSDSGNLAAIVNEAFVPCTGGCVQRATIYSAFSGPNATTKLVAPVYKEDFGSKRSGLSIQNTSMSDTTATVVFKVGASTYTYNNLPVPANSSALLLDMNNASVYPVANWSGGVVLPDNSLAAVTVTAGQPIIGIVNEAPTGGLVQDNINYETFNVTP